MISPAELSLSLEMGLIYGIVAIGIYLTFRVIDFSDLTCDGSFALGSVVSAVLIQKGMNPYLACLFSATAGGLAGLTTGLITSYFKVTEILSGILVAFMLYSVNLKLMNNVPNIVLTGESSIFIGMNPLLVLFCICSILWILLSLFLVTDFGLGLRCAGQNKKLTKACGISVTWMTILGLILGNACIGFAGGLFTQHQGFSDVSLGTGSLIMGLMAVLMGERLSLKPSVLKALAACLFGSVLYRVIIAFALHGESLGIKTQDLNLITGVLVILTMYLPRQSKISKN